MEQRRQLRLTEPRFRAAATLDRLRARSGFTLVEVIISILLTAVIVTSVFSVSLGSKTGDIKAERKLKAAVGTRQVSAMLRNFVTGDIGASSIPGPGGGVGGWSMTSGGIVDHSWTGFTCGGVRNDWALTAGDHCLTGVLGTFENAPYNARVWYHVDDMAAAPNPPIPGCPGCPLPAVAITATWTDP